MQLGRHHVCCQKIEVFCSCLLVLLCNKMLFHTVWLLIFVRVHWSEPSEHFHHAAAPLWVFYSHYSAAVVAQHAVKDIWIIEQHRTLVCSKKGNKANQRHGKKSDVFHYEVKWRNLSRLALTRGRTETAWRVSARRLFSGYTNIWSGSNCLMHQTDTQWMKNPRSRPEWSVKSADSVSLKLQDGGSLWT